MTDAHALSATPHPGLFPEWPELRGSFQRLKLKPGRMGLIASVKIRCEGEIFSAFTFNPRLVQKLEVIARRARFIDGRPILWLKGPIEEIEDQGIIQDGMRIVYFDDRTPYPRGIPMPDLPS